MIFDGQILSKKNILNIFDCTGWSKKYPALNQSLSSAPELVLNKLLSPINESFFQDKVKRKRLFTIMAEAESRGDLKELALLLEKGFADHKVVTKLNQFFRRKDLTQEEKLKTLKFFSSSAKDNLRKIIVFKNFLQIIELHREELAKIFSHQEKEQVRQRMILVLDEISTGLENRHWSYLSEIVNKGHSPLINWANAGLEGDPQILLDIVTNPGLITDVTYLKEGLKSGIRCSNRASTNDFRINVAQELNQVMVSLKDDTREDFQNVLLHGLTKYLAFQEFCEERESPQGLKSYFNILKLASDVLNSDSDFIFLKEIHQIFQKDRFAFVDFLNSKSFFALRSQLIDLGNEGVDDEFTKVAFQVISRFKQDDVQFLSDALATFSDESSPGRAWLYGWSKFWMTQSPAEKMELINLFSLFIDQEINVSQTMNVVQVLMESFPDFFVNNEGDQLSGGGPHEWTLILDHFDSEKTQEELSVLFSNRGLFEFLQVLTQEPIKSGAKKPVGTTPVNSPVILIVKPSVLQEVQSKLCFQHLTQKYENDATYYQLVNSLPESCLSILGEVGFVGQIYLWMNSSEAYFKDHYQVGNYHSANGVWSPGMLQFIFSAAVKADRFLNSQTGSTGLQENLDQIHQVLTDPTLLETFHQFSQLFTLVSSQTELDKKLTAFFSTKTNAEITPFVRDAFSLMKGTAAPIDHHFKPVKCTDLSSLAGANPCLETNESAKRLTGMLRILKRKNEAGTSLLQTLIKWLHPKGGIAIPFRDRKAQTRHTDLDEVVRFLYDLSSPKTKKPFNFYQKSEATRLQGTTLDRLEVVIREIGFLNNFYGAYFKNNVATAVDYRKEILDSEKLLSLMKNSGGVLRGTGIFPKATKDKLKNIKSTYLSLAEVADTYPHANGTTKTYGPFIQGLLTSIAESSKLSTQDFSPYQLPEPEVVEGHNGVFLTQAVEMSALRHLSAVVRSRFDKNLSALDSERFKMINQHLIARHDLVKLQTGLQSVLDRFLDNDRNQVNLLIDDTLHFMSELNPEEQRLLEMAAIKILSLLSDDHLTAKNINKMSGMIELAVELWPEIRVMLKQLKNKQETLVFLNRLLDHIVENPLAFDRLFNEVTENIFGLGDLKSIILHPESANSLVSFINQMVLSKDIKTDLNWLETFQLIFAAEDVQWTPVKNWISARVGTSESKLTVSLLIGFLGEKNHEGYRFQRIMDELFLNHREQLNHFLQETFKSLDLKPD